ncbi:MAG: hypothetical protein EA394_00760 [Bacteroidia bacterium]|nr:MAG: hypothetical protein EA394_00760 [Bacteroidia bacterium]
MSIAEHITHAAVHALGWSVIHSLWQIVLIALLWQLSLLLTKKGPATLRYNLSLIAMLAIPLSFLATFFRQYNVYHNARQIVSIEFDTAAWVRAAGDRTFYLLDKSQPAFLDRFEAFTPLVFWLYLVGVTILSAYALISYFNIYRLKRKNNFDPDPQWEERFKPLMQRCGIRKTIPVRVSEKLSVPVVVGFLKPWILLPAAMFFSMTTEQIEAIFLHELYHIRRKDHMVNALQNLLEILFFFHPVTWWISKHIRKLREECVDEWVVAETGTPLVYAGALINLEETRSTTMPQPMVAATQSKNHLFTRIKNMMTMKTKSLNTGQKMAAMLAIVFALASIAWINPPVTINLAETGSNFGYQLTDDAYAHLHELSDPANRDKQDEPQKQDEKVPVTIHLHDGSSISFEGLSEREREVLKDAMKELQQAMLEVNRDIFEKLQSGEFRRQMEEAGEKVRTAQEEVRKAMDQIEIQLHDESFRDEMRQAGEEIRNAMQEIEGIDWHEISREVQKSMEEINKAMKEANMNMEDMTPMIMELIQGFGEVAGKGLDSLMPALQEMLEELEKIMPEPQNNENR